jgi:Cys-rich repeat protein
MQICRTDSQCPAGQLCLPAGVNGRSCQCPQRPRADLGPEPAQATNAGNGIPGEGLPGFFFCAPLEDDTSVSERVIVRVRNVGAAAAAPSSLEVTFLGGDSREAAVGPLPPGAASVHSVPIPESCYGDDGGNCTYEIMVDADDDVPEQSNANNTRSSICLQPEG